MYVLKAENKNGVLQNGVTETCPNAGQFWKWTPEQFLALPAYPDLKGKGAKGDASCRDLLAEEERGHER